MPTRQTLRDFLTSIGSAAPGISIPVDPGSNGLVDEGDDLGREPNTGKQLLDFSSGESLLGDYASFVTRENDYQIAPGAHEAPSTDRGSSLPAAENTGATEVFAKSNTRTNTVSLNRSNSEIFDLSGYPLGTIVDKTGDGSAENGNELLPGVVSADADSDLRRNQSVAVTATFASLRKYNNFSPTSGVSGFSSDDMRTSITSDALGERNMVFQNGKGEYKVAVSEISKQIKLEDLSQIARSMILKSAGWDKTILAKEAANPDEIFDDINSQTLSKFPEFTRDYLGTVDAFRAQDSYGMPASPDGSSFLDGRGDAVQKSFAESTYMRTRGGTHTPDQPFAEDPSKRSADRLQSLQAGIAMMGLASLIDKKFIDIQGYTNDLMVSNDTVLRGPYYLGTSVKSDVKAKTRALIRTFMFQTGIYSYEKCVSEGLYSCFGYDSAIDGQAAVTISTSNISSLYDDMIGKISNDLNGEYFRSPMGLSQGFWRAVSESTIRTVSSLTNAAMAIDGADYARCLLGMKDTLVFKVMNVFASIGYQRLTIQNLMSSEVESGQEPQNPYDIDGYPNAPGTRQMKSRDGKLLSRSSLAWRNSALPSMFILPVEAMAASLDLDYTFDPTRGASPIKGMLGSTMYDKTYVKLTRNSNNIPSIAAKMLEDRLGAEYLPFYFRDLRTNEIVAFHGFLETLSDGFTANFNETRGFGRSDAVQNYSNTSRTIGLSFWIVSTSKEDFDEMWFKINKLTTLVYPQYTRGRLASVRDTATIFGANQTINFEQPFSQVAGGTPVVRMRVGDLIKTNYTRSNFARLFGVGNDTFNATTTSTDFFSALKTVSAALKNVSNFDIRLAPFLVFAGSPIELTRLISGNSPGGAGSMFADFATEILASTMENGFVNWLLTANRSKVFQKQDSDAAAAGFGFFGSGTTILKARSTPYQVEIGGEIRLLRLRRPVFCKVEKEGAGFERTGATYEITITDNTVGSEFVNAKCKVSAADLYVDAGQIVDILGFPGVLLSLGLIAGASGNLSNLASNAISSALANGGIAADIPLADIFGSLGRTFTSPYNNPITKAFEDRMGEGLAGVVKQMSFTWLDTGGWEVDWNSRAPTACKVNMTFAPIHDISPGLDSNGFNRAPIYNVGQIMHDTFGSPRSDGGSASRLFYKKGGATAENAKNPTDKG